MTEEPWSVGVMLRELAKPAALKAQRTFRLFPREICLISGAPRSGTSALINWLSDQPRVSAFQESRILVAIHRFIEEIDRFNTLQRDAAKHVTVARQLVLDYYLSSRILIGQRLLVDKEPLEPIAFPSRDYEQFLAHVRRLFPESKLLLAIRDPVDTIWSMRGRTWGRSLAKSETRRFTIEEHIENWRACATLVLLYCSDPNTYVVQFGRLVNDPVNESRRILDFLNLRKGTSFQPRETSNIGFSHEELEEIVSKVQPQLDLLRAQGISDLS